MAWYNKIGKGAAAFAGGVAEELPGTLDRRFQGQQLNRQEQKYREGLSYRDRQDREAQILALYASNPEAAIAEAESFDPQLAARLRSTLIGAETTGLQTASRGMVTAAAGARGAAGAADLTSEEGRRAFRQQTQESISGLSSGSAQIEALAQQSRLSPEVARQTIQPSVNITQETLKSLTQQLAQTEDLDLLISQVDPTAPLESQAILDKRIEEVAKGLGITDTNIQTLRTRTRQAAQRLNEERFRESLHYYVQAKRPDLIRTAMARFKVGISTEAEGEAAIAAIETGLRTDIDEPTRLQISAAEEAWSTAKMVARYDPDSARQMMDDSIDAMDAAGQPKIAALHRREKPGILRSATSQGFEGFRQSTLDAYRQEPERLIGWVEEELRVTIPDGGRPAPQQVQEAIEKVRKRAWPEYTERTPASLQEDVDDFVKLWRAGREDAAIVRLRTLDPARQAGIEAGALAQGIDVNAYGNVGPTIQPAFSGGADSSLPFMPTSATGAR